MFKANEFLSIKKFAQNSFQFQFNLINLLHLLPATALFLSLVSLFETGHGSETIAEKKTLIIDEGNKNVIIPK